MLAAAGGWEQCVRALLEAGASKQATSKDGKTAADIALERQQDDATFADGSSDYARVLDALGCAPAAPRSQPPTAPPAAAAAEMRRLLQQLSDAAKQSEALRADLSKARSDAQVSPCSWRAVPCEHRCTQPPPPLASLMPCAVPVPLSLLPSLSAI